MGGMVTGWLRRRRNGLTSEAVAVSTGGLGSIKYGSHGDARLRSVRREGARMGV